MIRPASAADIPAMVAVLRWGYERSIEAGRLTLDENLVRRTLFQCVSQTARHWAAVAETSGTVEAMLVGGLQPVYCAAVELEATDIWWVATDRSSPMDNLRLMMAFQLWAAKNPKVARIQCGATAIMGDGDRAGRILEGLGMQRFGQIYRKDVAR